MPGQMMVVSILIFCWRDAGDNNRAALCVLILFIVVSIWMDQLRDDTSLIPRYV